MRDDIEPLSTNDIATPAGHYSPGVAWNGLIFVSGQLPIEADGTRLNDRPFDEQARQALSNMLAVTRAGGARPDDVLKVTVYIVGIDNWSAFNAIYAEMFGDARPARAIVPVPELHHGFLVEVEAVAVRRPG